MFHLYLTTFLNRVSILEPQNFISCISLTYALSYTRKSKVSAVKKKKKVTKMKFSFQFIFNNQFLTIAPILFFAIFYVQKISFFDSETPFESRINTNKVLRSDTCTNSLFVWLSLTHKIKQSSENKFTQNWVQLPSCLFYSKQ